MSLSKCLAEVPVLNIKYLDEEPKYECLVCNKYTIYEKDKHVLQCWVCRTRFIIKCKCVGPIKCVREVNIRGDSFTGKSIVTNIYKFLEKNHNIILTKESFQENKLHIDKPYGMTSYYISCTWYELNGVKFKYIDCPSC